MQNPDSNTDRRPPGKLVPLESLRSYGGETRRLLSEGLIQALRCGAQALQAQQGKQAKLPKRRTNSVGQAPPDDGFAECQAKH